MARAPGDVLLHDKDVLLHDKTEVLVRGPTELVDGAGKPTPKFQAYQQYRAEYERRLEDLQRRDREVQANPFELQRWPMERKAFADRVDQAMRDWEVLGYKAEVEASTGFPAQIGQHQPPGPADGGQANDNEY